MPHPAKWIDAKPEDLVTEVAARSLKQRFKPVQRYLPLAALQHEQDQEYVHQLRVWSRRAEATLEMYCDLVPQWRVVWLQEQLKRIRKATNAARDDDVFARRVESDDSPEAVRLLRRIRRHRQVSQESLIAVHQRLDRKDRFERRIGQLIERVRIRGKKPPKKDIYFADWARPKLAAAAQAFFDLGDEDLSDLETLHQFRIAGKRLRYAMELLSGAFSSELKGALYPLLVRLQDELGKINDRASAQARIRHWLQEEDDQEEITYLAEMLENEQADLRDAHEEFLAWWSGERQDQFGDAFARVLAGEGAASSG